MNGRARPARQSERAGPQSWPHFLPTTPVYHNIPLAPVIGRVAIANNIASFIRPGAPGIEGIQFRVITLPPMVRS